MVEGLDVGFDPRIYSKVCTHCKHQRITPSKNTACDAFPDGIPDVIWSGKITIENLTLGTMGFNLSP